MRCLAALLLLALAACDTSAPPRLGPPTPAGPDTTRTDTTRTDTTRTDTTRTDTTQAPAPGPVLVIGDSVMRWNADQGAGVADVIAAETGREVLDASVSGARLSAPTGDIRSQYRAGGWDWVVMNGGANDFRTECECGPCEAELDAMVSDDGLSGDIPDFVRRVAADGSRVLVLGYYAGPAGTQTGFSPCADEITELSWRLHAMAAASDSAVFASAAAVIDPADPGHYDPDRVHPSVEGSRLIGAYVAEIIEAGE